MTASLLPSPTSCAIILFEVGALFTLSFVVSPDLRIHIYPHLASIPCHIPAPYCIHFAVMFQALEMEPSMSPNIVGAWWFPQDMSIDAQRMFRVLEQACSKGGVEILQG